MTEKEIIEALHSIRNSVCDAETHASTANEYAAECETAIENAASAAEEAREYAEQARDELNGLIRYFESEEVVFSSQSEKIRADARGEVLAGVMKALGDLFSQSVGGEVNFNVERGQNE